MKKKVMLVMLCVILVAIGLTCYTEKEEPIEAAQETVQKTKTIELAEDFEDEKEPAGEVSTEKDSPVETADLEEKVIETEIQVEPKEEVKKQATLEKKEKSQDAKLEQKESASEKSKQKEQKAETLEEPEMPKEPEPPRHTHSWEPVYAKRQVEKVKLIPWTKCYCCGADMTGNVYHIDEHLLNDEPNVSYGTEYREETYYETESYISGYKCSCGKMKSN